MHRFARTIKALFIVALVAPALTTYGHCEDGGCDHASGDYGPGLPTLPSIMVSTPPVIATRIDGQPGSDGLDPLFQASVRVQKSTNTIVPTGGTGFGMHASLIRVPDWIPISERPHPTAEYYLYTAGHSGNDIHMAWSDSLTGVWQRWNPLGLVDLDGDGQPDAGANDRAWGENGNNTGAYTPGRGVLDLDIGPQAPPVTQPNGQTVNPGHYIDLGDIELEDHISSPEVIVDDANQRLILMFHGMYRSELSPGQVGRGRYHRTVMGTSKYGLNFNIEEDGGEAGHGLRDIALTGTYTRFLQIDAEINGEQVVQTIGVDRSGILYMAPLYTDAGENATLANADEEGGLFNPGANSSYTDAGGTYWTVLKDSEGNSIKPHAGAVRHPYVVPDGEEGTLRGGGRHVDVWYDPEVDRDTLYYFYTSTGDRPESILMTRVSLAGLTEEQRLDPANWARIDEQEHLILAPELEWEGALKPLETSVSGAKSQGHFMRDPHLFFDDDSGKLYMLYNADGESKIGLAELTIVPEPATGALLGTGGFFMYARRR